MPVVLIAALKVVGVKLFEAVIAPKVLEWVMFKSAKGIVKHSKTPHDDEFLAKVESAYYGKPESESK